MSDNSDTESELGESHYGPDMKVEQGPNEPAPCEQVRDAIEKLMLLDLSSAIKDYDVFRRTAINSSRHIIRFLNALVDEERTCGIHLRVILAMLTRLDFLLLLFEYRKLIRNGETLAGNAMPPVCWVDVIFTKLGHAIIKVTTEMSLRQNDGCHQELVGSLKKQREQEWLRTAAQLPDSWDDMIRTIASNSCSPISKRLALRLMYAAYVLRPQLVQCNPWILKSTGTITPTEAHKLLFIGVEKILYSPRMGAHLVDQDFKINCSILISLVASIHVAFPETMSSHSIFKPQWLAYMVRAVEVVLQDESQVVAPVEILHELDIAQSILLRWGHGIEWCWSIWADHRTEGARIITWMTFIWLLHVCSFAPSTTFKPLSFDTTLRTKILNYRIPASAALLDVLRFVVTQPSLLGYLDSISVTPFLYKLCWSILVIVESYVERPDPHLKSRLAKIHQHLIRLYFTLEENPETLPVRSLLIESLTLTDKGILLLALKSLVDDQTFDFSTAFDKSIVLCIGRLNELNSHQICSKRQAIALFSYIYTLIRHSQAEGFPLRDTDSLFLGALANHVANHSSNSSLPDVLLEAFLVARSFTHVDAAHLSSEQEEMMWILATKKSTSDFTAASAFACFIVTCGRTCPLLCVEAWNYLEGAFLILLGHNFPEQDEPIAILASLSICKALSVLISDNLPGSLCATHSPWAMDLCRYLQNILGAVEATNPILTRYHGALRDRLERAGQVLIDQIKGNPKDLQTNDSMIVTRLIYLSDYTSSRLLVFFELGEGVCELIG